MNIGADPFDPTTNVGLLRAVMGATESKPLVPPVEGRADYTMWSDLELLGSLIAADDNVYRAAGDLYTQMAVQYAHAERSVKTDDLTLDTKTRSASFLKIAQSYYERADAQDASEAGDMFEVVSRTRSHHSCRVEGSPWPARCGGRGCPGC